MSVPSAATEPSMPAAPPPVAERPPAPQFSLSRRLVFGGFGALVVLAAVFYVWWGLSYGVWLDNGVYSVVITLALFGLAGMWLVLPAPPRRSPPA